jgi:hypothetical protein
VTSRARLDVLSHVLWAGAAAEAVRRTGRFSRRDVAGAAAFGAMPDLVAVVPVAAWATSAPSFLDAVVAYVMAVPGREPAMPEWARLAEHHLHCSAHSLVVLALVTLAFAGLLRGLLPSLLGWWMHILLDIPTHSEDYYAVTVFYPFTQWSFDGVAWTAPAVLAANYAALVAAYGGLYLTRRRA